MKNGLKRLLVVFIIAISWCNAQARCVSYATRGAGWTVTSKDCTYTFKANKLTDSACFYFAWYQGKTLLGTGSTYTKTFTTNDSAEYKLVIKNSCDSTCGDTTIEKKVVYNCAPKCNWASKKPGYSFTNKNCVYTFEANNLNDSCVTYKWYKGPDSIGTGRLLTYTFKENGYSNICLKVIDTCMDCDTSICKIMQYNCGSKCDWKARNAGWSYSKTGCTYVFEGNNLRDSCVTYTWVKGQKVLGTGRIFTYVLETNDTTEICLKLKDTCNKCDTVICKDIVGECGSKCNWKSRNVGYSFTNKDCVYTFEANNLKDSCVLYKWYKGNDLIGTGRVLTYTFNTNGYSNICLKVIDTCKNCDTSICKIVQYNCGSKCNWRGKDVGWGYTKKGCTYILEANNLRDTCMSYTWIEAGKVLGTGRVLTYTFTQNGIAEICLKVKDNCNRCDTVICKAIKDSCAMGIGYVNNANQELIIYPNPSNTGFTIQKLTASNPAVTLYNAIGVKVLADPIIQNNGIYISTENLSDGVYLLRIDTGEAMLTQRIIVRH